MSPQRRDPVQSRNKPKPLAADPYGVRGGLTGNGGLPHRRRVKLVIHLPMIPVKAERVCLFRRGYPQGSHRSRFPRTQTRAWASRVAMRFAELCTTTPNLTLWCEDCAYTVCHRHAPGHLNRRDGHSDPREERHFVVPPRRSPTILGLTLPQRSRVG